MRFSSILGESFTGIYKVLQVKSMNEATIDDMKKVMDQLHRMPEDGKVILFALFQLALASVRSQEAFGVFREKYPGLKEVDLVTFVHIVNCLPNKHVDDCFHLHYLPLIHILEKFRLYPGLTKYLPIGLQSNLLRPEGLAYIPRWTEKFPKRSTFAL